MKIFRIAAVLLCAGILMAEDTIRLPEPQKKGGTPLMDAVSARRSNRKIASAPLTQQQISDILYVAAGVTSADGKLSIPTARNVQDTTIFAALPEGVYRYNAKENTLELQAKGDFRPLCGMQKAMHAGSPMVLIFTSDQDKLESLPEKSREAMAAVHIGSSVQNVYLYAAANQLATVVCGSVDIPKLARAIKLGPQYRIWLTQPIGTAK